MDLLLREFVVEMTEKPDSDQFLVGKQGMTIITRALKTGLRTGIVNLTDKQIQTDKLIFHGKKILLINLFICLFNY